MRAVVVFESFFGNTEKVARAVVTGLEPTLEVSLLPIAKATAQTLAGASLLVVGSPTRGFGPSPETKAWLKALAPGSLNGIAVAAFDTRMGVNEVNSRIYRTLAGIFGFAAEPMAAALVRAGGVQIAPPEGYFVLDREGPLKEGELERATAWGQQIAAKLAQRA
jgi:flavodoxin